MLRRLTLVLAGGALLLAIGAGPTLAVQSAYVDTDCTKPLQDGQIPETSTDLRVWLKLGSTNVADLHWWIYNDNGGLVANGEFTTLQCTISNGNGSATYKQYLTGWNPVIVGGATTSYTLKVTYDGGSKDGQSFSGDGFTVIPVLA